MSNYTLLAADFTHRKHYATDLTAESKVGTLCILIEAFDRSNFISFSRLEAMSGLSRSELIDLKPYLECMMAADITSRVDLAEPGLFLES